MSLLRPRGIVASLVNTVVWVIVAGYAGVALIRSNPQLPPGILVAAAAAAMFALAFGPARGLLHRDDDNEATDLEDAERRLQALEERAAVAGILEARVAELEERVEFTERLLAQNKEVVPLPRAAQ